MIRRLVLSLAMLASASAPAVSNAAPPSQVRLLGHRINEEPPDPRWNGGYVLPNEEQPFRFDRAVAGRAQHGDILSVGTYRGFHLGAAAGVGAPKTRLHAKTYLFDVDSGVRTYNAGLIQLIDREPSRARFLDRVPTEVFPNVSIDSYRRLAEQPHAGRTILGSDEIYLNVRRGVKRRAYVPIRGSIAGPQTLADLGRVLRSTQRKLSVIDLSNALDYLHDAGSMDAFVANLRGLPLAEDALLLLTDERSPHIDYKLTSWEYNVLRVADFVRAYDRRGNVRGEGFHYLLLDHAWDNDARVSKSEDAVEPPAGFSSTFAPKGRN